MPEIRVRVGPSVDRAAFDAVFGSIAASAERANKKISSDAAKTSKSRVSEEDKANKKIAADAARAAKTRASEESKAAKKGAKEREAITKAETKAGEAEAKRMAKTFEGVERIKVELAKRGAAQRAAAEKAAYKETEKAAKDAANAQKKAASDAAKEAASSASKLRPRIGIGLGGGVSMSAGGVGGFAIGGARYGMSVASDLAHGFGVKTDLGSHFAANAELDTKAVQISNEGYDPAGGRNGQRVDSGDLKRDAFRIGNSTGTSANDVMGGMQKFVGQTGDLATARESMEDLAKISKAYGADMEDVVGAAADISNKLGDIPEKAKAIASAMRTIVGESKTGGISIREFAAQMSKVAAFAPRMAGDASKNIGTLAAIAQEARLTGGSASASSAATSVSSLMSQLGKAKTINQFDKLGISLNGEGAESGKMRNIEDIIVDGMNRTRKATSSQSMGARSALFGSAQSMRAVSGFGAIGDAAARATNGTEAEKTAAATKAMRDEFSRLTDAAVSAKEVDESFAATMATGQSQAEIFNNQMQETAGELQTALLPAFKALSPAIIGATRGLVELIGRALGTDLHTGVSTDMATIKVRNDEAMVNRAIAHGNEKGTDGKAIGVSSKVISTSEKDMRTALDLASKSRDAAAGLRNMNAFERTTKGYSKEDTEINAKAEDKKAKDAEDSAAHLKALLDQLKSGTLNVKIVNPTATGPKAAEPSTDSSGGEPSGN